MMSKRSGKYEVSRQTGSKRKRIIMAEKLKTKRIMSVQKPDIGGFTKDDSLKKMQGPSIGVVSKEKPVTYKDLKTVPEKSPSSEASDSESDSVNSGVTGEVQDEVLTKKLTGDSNSESSDSESSDEEVKTSQKISIRTSKSNKLSKEVKSDSSSDSSASDSESSSEEDEVSPSKAKRVKLSNEKEVESVDIEVESEDESSEHGVSDESDGDATNNNEDNGDNSKLSEEVDETTGGNDEYDAIRKEIANMPFDELQKLRERVGSKVYYQALFGKGTHETGKKRIFKRANKNRPMEMSSKAPVRRYRQMQAKKAKVTRDPRFDDLSGTYNENLFKRSYGFIDDIKAKEKEKLQNKLKKEKDPDKAFKMKYLVNRMTQQEKSDREKERRLQQSREIKKKEKALVQDGKTPFYLKKSEKKKLELAEKFRELKKSGKLEKYLNRKRKKTASKDRKHLPNVHSR